MRSPHSRLVTTIIVGLFVAAACSSANDPGPAVSPFLTASPPAVSPFLSASPSVPSPFPTGSSPAPSPFPTVSLPPATSPSTTPTTTSPPAVSPRPVLIAAGQWHTCAVTAVGGVKCWGHNAIGQLGDGSTIDVNVPVDVTGLASGVIAVTAGFGHTCALTSGGEVKCWGNNEKGSLGDGTTTNSTVPVDVVGLAGGVSAIGAGGGHTCALTSGGAVKCWGYNIGGQLGDGTTIDSSVPVDVVGLARDVIAIAAGAYHTCALTSSGSVKCWGASSRLGESTVAVDVLGLTSGIIAIDASANLHTCVLTSGGGVKCWGPNSHGKLGDGTAINRLVPVDVVGLANTVTAIAVGGNHTCALASGGAVICWGYNGYGQLGDGSTTESLTPIGVSGLAADVTAVAAGGLHTCALTGLGDVKCWGRNTYGQLGDGTRTNSSIPVDVDIVGPSSAP